MKNKWIDILLRMPGVQRLCWIRSRNHEPILAVFCIGFKGSYSFKRFEDLGQEFYRDVGFNPEEWRYASKKECIEFQNKLLVNNI